MERVSIWLNRNSMYIALVAAWIAMCGSLYFSEVKGYIPCTLCWYQRILMYPLTMVIAVGLLRRDWHLPYYILPFSIFGMCVSTYHYLLEKTDIFAGATVCRQGVSCTTQWINWFGFVTIPFLALTAFLIITLMSVIALINHEPVGEDEEGDPLRTPWLRVTAPVVVVLAVFAVLFITGLRRPRPKAARRQRRLSRWRTSRQGRRNWRMPTTARTPWRAGGSCSANRVLHAMASMPRVWRTWGIRWPVRTS